MATRRFLRAAVTAGDGFREVLAESRGAPMRAAAATGVLASVATVASVVATLAGALATAATAAPACGAVGRAG